MDLGSMVGDFWVGEDLLFNYFNYNVLLNIY